MKQRILRSFTIVPPELYVERAADRQVAELVGDMGRPGYVLVARQMGKTNLLLNAKRRLGKDGNVFSYLDVSNPFPNIRLFFRNVIDTVAGSSEALQNTYNQILTERKDPHWELRPPHKEHERELCLLLRSIAGKIIICLDEIDALTSLEYSDQIFSFIRSVYFSGRANFDELSRLTYILSGVAEPNEIIKNKDISPFNIGEKIYLDGFNSDEARAFFNKANLNFSAAAIDRIAYWTGGHPRMTWDVASILEVAAQPVDAALVDASVRDLYFSDSTPPPVDHIKTLVADSKEIREAIIAMHYERTASIPEAVRTKLYLAGICRFDRATKDLAFASRVIEDSLSEDYLHDLPSLREVSFTDATQKVVSREFAAAIPLFEQYISQSQDTVQRELSRFWIGVCQFNLGDYAECAKSLQETQIALSAEQIALSDFYLGVSLYHEQEFGKAIPYLRRATQGALDNSLTASKYEAAVYLAECLLIDGQERAPEVGDFMNWVLAAREEISSLDPISRPITSTLTLASTALARSLRHRDSTQAAQGLIRSLVKGAQHDDLIRVLLAQYEIETTSSIKRQALNQCTKAVLQERKFSQYGALSDISFISCYRLMSCMHKEKMVKNLDEIFDHVHGVIPAAQKDNWLSEMVACAMQESNVELAVRFTDRTLDLDKNHLLPKERRALWLYGIIFDQARGVSRYGNDYVSSYSDEETPQSSELRVLYTIVEESLRNFATDLAQRAFSIMKRGGDASLDNSKRTSSVQLLNNYLDVRFKLSEGSTNDSIHAAKGLILKCATFGDFDLPYFPPDFQKAIQRMLSMAVNSHGVNPIRRGKKYGRNEVVTVSYDGINKSGKYKKFLPDLERGLCILVS